MKPLRLALAIALLLVPVAGVRAATIPATDAEGQILALVNEARADAGLVPLRSDDRLWTVADERAGAMASSNVLSHGAGGPLEANLDAQAIPWIRYGEVIAWSSARETSSAASLFGLWASSPPHWALLMSRSFNYVGIGLSYSPTGRTYGSIVFTESRDHTAATTPLVRGSRSGDDVRWSWRAADVALQTHTAGIRDYAIQQRTDRGTWVNVSTATTVTSRSLRNRASGHWYGLRVRARDRAGTVGSWSREIRVWVP